MNVFQRSWALTKASFSIIKQNPRLLWFPIFALVWMLGYCVALSLPIVLALLASSTSIGWWMYVVVIFAIYLGESVIWTFFNVAMTYIVKGFWEGKKIGIISATGFAFSKFNLILGWGLISATVGVLITLLSSLAGKYAGMARSAGKAGWRFLTVFVVPVIVYKNDISATGAIKESKNVIFKKWGEHFVRRLSHGLFAFLFGLLGVLITIGLVYLATILPASITGSAMILGIPAIFVVIGVSCVMYFLVLSLVFNVANKVFDAALYVYATKRSVPAGYKKIGIEQAFQKR